MSSLARSLSVPLTDSDGAGYERPWRVNVRGALSAGVRVVLALPAATRGYSSIPVAVLGWLRGAGHLEAAGSNHGGVEGGDLF